MTRDNGLVKRRVLPFRPFRELIVRAQCIAQILTRIGITTTSSSPLFRKTLFSHHVLNARAAKCEKNKLCIVTCDFRITRADLCAVCSPNLRLSLQTISNSSFSIITRITRFTIDSPERKVFQRNLQISRLRECMIKIFKSLQLSQLRSDISIEDRVIIAISGNLYFIFFFVKSLL